MSTKSGTRRVQRGEAKPQSEPLEKPVKIHYLPPSSPKVTPQSGRAPTISRKKLRDPKHVAVVKRALHFADAKSEDKPEHKPSVRRSARHANVDSKANAKSGQEGKPLHPPVRRSSRSRKGTHSDGALGTASTAAEITLRKSMLEPLDVPVHAQTKQYKQAQAQMGTITNGQCYIAVSSICPYPILGLFAGRDIKKKEVVTAYGGLLKPLHDVRKAKSSTCTTHVRRIPNSIYVRDGYEMSRCFSRASESDMRKQMSLDPSERTHMKVTNKAPQELAHLTPEEYKVVQDRIVVEGLGYMANTDKQSLQNVNVKNVQLTRQGLLPVAMYYVATRDIAAHEEILAPYNNRDPSIFKN